MKNPTVDGRRPSHFRTCHRWTDCMLAFACFRACHRLYHQEQALRSFVHMRKALFIFDVAALFGGLLLCLSPIYLAGEPTQLLCHLRTSILPLGLAASASGQIARTVVSEQCGCCEQGGSVRKGSPGQDKTEACDYRNEQ